MPEDAAVMHRDEVDTSLPVVARLIASQFPHWADRPIEPIRSTGTVNAIYRLGADLCVRLPRVGRWVPDLEHELRWLPLLAHHLAIAIPEPVAQGRPGGAYPFPWAVFTWLPGVPWSRAGVDDEGEAARHLAAFLRALHAVDPTRGPAAGRSGSLGARDARTREAIEEAGALIDAHGATAAWEAAIRLPEWSGEPVWTHGDLLPPNLLVDRGRLSAVIDFGIAGVGDPACDLLAAWSAFSAAARMDFRAALEVDDATWARGRGWALSVALLIIPYYATSNPSFSEMARRTIEEIVREHAEGIA
jgi:aminoglycoside phosphotransferase (APT) family kinase protein